MSRSTFRTPPPRMTITLDTDIGSDVDDLLALAVALGSPELDVAAVTTVYGDVALRARIVAKAYEAAGIPAPVIAAGLAETRSGRDVWWAGHEGSTIADLDAAVFASDRDALEVLVASEIVVPIGPLTNLAAALEAPGHRIRRLVMMGGAFDGRTEHNIRSDIDAASVVFDSETEIVAVGIDITERVRFTESQLSGLPDGLGSLLDAEVRRYWSFADHAWNTPHDAIAILMLTSPELFTCARGRIRVDRSDGTTRFVPSPAGRHRIVTGIDVDGVVQQIETRIRRVCASRPDGGTARRR